MAKQNMEVLRISVSPMIRAAVRDAASRRGISLSEFARRAISRAAGMKGDPVVYHYHDAPPTDQSVARYMHSAAGRAAVIDAIREGTSEPPRRHAGRARQAVPV